MSISIAQKIIQEKGARIEFLVLKNEEGKENFFYLIMSEKEAVKMQKKIDSNQPVTPDEYGVILFQGTGSEAPLEVQDIVDDLIKEIDKN